MDGISTATVCGSQGTRFTRLEGESNCAFFGRAIILLFSSPFMWVANLVQSIGSNHSNPEDVESLKGRAYKPRSNVSKYHEGVAQEIVRIIEGEQGKHSLTFALPPGTPEHLFQKFKHVLNFAENDKMSEAIDKLPSEIRDCYEEFTGNAKAFFLGLKCQDRLFSTVEEAENQNPSKEPSAASNYDGLPNEIKDAYRSWLKSSFNIEDTSCSRVQFFSMMLVPEIKSEKFDSENQRQRFKLKRAKREVATGNLSYLESTDFMNGLGEDLWRKISEKVINKDKETALTELDEILKEI